MPPHSPPKAPAWVWWTLAGITLLAAAVRYWRLDNLPFGYWYDEAHKSLVAYRIAHGQDFPIYVTEVYGIEAGFPWLLAGWYRLLGPSFFGSRAVSAAIGLASVPLTFWVIRLLYRAHPQANALALASAGWLSALFWHVHWSRLGLENIAVPFFSVALLGLLAWAWQRPSAWAFAGAGAVLGLSQYTSPGARVLPLQALAVFALLAHGPWRQRLQFGLAFMLGALIVYAPLGVFFLKHPEWFFSRLAFTTTNARAGGWQFYIASGAKTLFSINFRGDSLVRHNLALRPALDPASSGFMAVGLAHIVRPGGRALMRAHLALLAALGVNLLPMVFSDGAPSFGRMLGAAPMVVVLPALGFVTLLVWARGRLLPLVLTAAAVAAGLNLYDYFFRFERQPGMFDAFEVGQWTLVAAASQASIGYLVVAESNLAHPAVQLARLLDGGTLRLINGDACLAFPLETAAPTTLAVLDPWLNRIQAFYPQAHVASVLHEPEIYPYGWILTLPAGARSTLAAAEPLARFGAAIDLLSVEITPGLFRAGDPLEIVLQWHARQATRTRYTRFVHLLSDAAPYLGGADAEPCQGWYSTDQWLPGDVVVDALTLQLPAGLPPGRYLLAAGFYDTLTGERLPVTAAGAWEPDRALIGSLAVE
jgi:hypothetical protein